ncbi:hypothetical protein [Methylobacterium sp. J-068]|uniref:hypothetical protein n=1 Tax=Methylobacterium sp. J-068 TaxID=2836649 RepID=UPI001FB8B87B|nr:hypothetical protein [Methylobacterium sp. J-068]
MPDEPASDEPETRDPRAEPTRKSAAAQRAERLKAALRDNLRRRKAQVRGRAVAESDETPEAGG